MSAQKDSPTLTITLTVRKPVKITKEDWPILAKADASDHDGKVECQAYRRWSWRLAVRQHSDGRAIVYGVYTYSSQYQGERYHDVRGGELVPAYGDIVAAIQRVGEWMQSTSPKDGERFAEVTRECLANLPAEDL
jgi:hypothetical protein